MPKTVFACLDTGLALAYFLETDLSKLLTRDGVRLVILVKQAYLSTCKENYTQPNVIFESMRDAEAERYRQSHRRRLHVWMEHVRRASASRAIPLTYVDTHRKRRESLAAPRQKFVSMLLRPVIGVLRRSRVARRLFVDALPSLFASHIYDDMLDHYQPDLIVSNCAGWRLDQYLLREGRRRNIRTALVVVGWDNPSSQGLPGARVDYAVVWSEAHKWELSAGVDWPAEKIFIGGMPLYDGYISGKWAMSRDEYFALHRLDPRKRLVSFAATALSISPNIHLIRILADMVGKQSLDAPAQLLIRMHPNHFKPQPHYLEEAQAIREVAGQYPDVHIVEPAEVPGGMERYSGEDFPEKASMLAYSDVMVTVYSTMVVEAALHDTPFISACIDAPEGWKGRFWVPLHDVPGWPTALRVNKQGAGKLALTQEELRRELNEYLANPEMDAAERRAFVASELTFVHGEATRKTAEILRSLI